MEYNIPITWQNYRTFTVEADNLQEALNKAVKEFMSITDEYYIDDSIQFDDDSLFEDYGDEEFDLNESFSLL